MKIFFKVYVYIFLLAGLMLNGCSKKENHNEVTQAKYEDIKVGNKLADFTIADQFDKKYSLTDNTKKVIFACSKDMGHIVKTLMLNKPVDYLISRNICFIADISSMPTIIYNLFALPDMQKSKYPILLIFDEKNAKRFENEDKKDYLMIISLDQKVITKIEFVNNQKDLEKVINNN
jgi:hypothetical protein